MKSFKELIVWQKSVTLAHEVYRVTKHFPDDERYGLAMQMRRAAVSIPSNLAEGHMRSSNKAFKQFVAISRGSCAELETQCLIAAELRYIDTKSFQRLEGLITEVAKMLSAFHTRLTVN